MGMYGRKIRLSLIKNSEEKMIKTVNFEAGIESWVSSTKCTKSNQTQSRSLAENIPKNKSKK